MKIVRYASLRSLRSLKKEQYFASLRSFANAHSLTATFVYLIARKLIVIVLYSTLRRYSYIVVRLRSPFLPRSTYYSANYCVWLVQCLTHFLPIHAGTLIKVRDVYLEYLGSRFFRSNKNVCDSRKGNAVAPGTVEPQRKWRSEIFLTHLRMVIACHLIKLLYQTESSVFENFILRINISHLMLTSPHGSA